MKGYYAIVTSSDVIPSFNDGVGKKIQAQIATFNMHGLNTEVLYLTKKKGFLNKIKRKISSRYYLNQLPDDFFDCDYYYFRHTITSFPIIPILGIFKTIKQKGKGKILLEIPTYPYDKHEIVSTNITNKINLFIDKILRKKFKKYIERIITVSNDDIIFNVKTIKMINGIICDDIPIRSIRKIISNHIYLIATAADFCYWNGYDRLIEGLYLYYKNNPSVDVFFYVVGGGKEISKYKKIVEKYNLSNYVFFTGFLDGHKLSEIYNNADIGICSLGCHRINLYLGSFLKSREYLARGFPMVSSTKIDVLPEGFPYCLYVPEDDSPINIQNIIDYYNAILQEDLTLVIKKIRQFAEKYCDMSITLKPVIDYIKSATLDS